jgi:hypothetical protein
MFEKQEMRPLRFGSIYIPMKVAHTTKYKNMWKTLQV